MQPVYVPKKPEEKAMQRALMQYFLPANFRTVRKALQTANREDLIGTGKNALVPPERTKEPMDRGRNPQRRNEIPPKKGKQTKKSVDKRRRNG